MSRSDVECLCCKSRRIGWKSAWAGSRTRWVMCCRSSTRSLPPQAVLRGGDATRRDVTEALYPLRPRCLHSLSNLPVNVGRLFSLHQPDETGLAFIGSVPLSPLFLRLLSVAACLRIHCQFPCSLSDSIDGAIANRLSASSNGPINISGRSAAGVPAATLSCRRVPTDVDRQRAQSDHSACPVCPLRSPQRRPPLYAHRQDA